MEWIEASHRCPTNDAQSTVAYWLGGCVDVIPHGLCNPYSMGDQLLNGTQYGVRRVTVGEDEKCGRVRRHGEHD